MVLRTGFFPTQEGWNDNPDLPVSCQMMMNFGKGTPLVKIFSNW